MVLLTKVLAFHINLTTIYIDKPSFIGFIKCALSKRYRKRRNKVLAFRIALKTHCRLISIYLVLEIAIEGITKGFKARLREKSSVENPSRMESTSNLSILLLIEKRIWNIRVTEAATEAQSL